MRKSKKSKTKKKLKPKKYPQKRKKFSNKTIEKLNKIIYCQKCNKYIPLDSPERQKHHIISLSKGGTNNIRNILVCCIDCHYSFHEEEFQARGISIEKFRNKIYEEFKQKKLKKLMSYSYQNLRNQTYSITEMRD